MIYFEQKAGNFGQAMAAPVVPLPMALIYAWSIRMLHRRPREYQFLYSDKNVTVDDVYVKLDNTDNCRFTGPAGTFPTSAFLII